MPGDALDPAVEARGREFIAEASRPECCADRLREIVRDWNALVRVIGRRHPVLRAVAAHPNAPPELLARLAPIEAEAVCANPVAPLLALEPGFLSQLDFWGVQALLRCPDAPAPLVARIAAGSADYGAEAEEAARLHVSLVGDVAAEQWAEEVRAYWRGHLAALPEPQRQEVAELVELGHAPESLFSGGAPMPAACSSAPTTDALYLLLTERATFTRCIPFESPDAGKRPQGPFPLPWTASVALRCWLRLRGGHGGVWKPALAQSPLLARAAVNSLIGRRAGYIDREVSRVVLRHHCVTPRMRRARRDAAVGEKFAWSYERSGALALAIAHLSPFRPSWAHRCAVHLVGNYLWRPRLIAALALPRQNTEELKRLTSDGNRLVRAAAQARLRGEEFTWE